VNQNHIGIPVAINIRPMAASLFCVMIVFKKSAAEIRITIAGTTG
jgi:hypothetical protein